MFHLAPIMGNQIVKIYSLIQHSGVETKQNTSQVIVAVLTQYAALRQPVLWTNDRRSVATDLCIRESRDRPQQSIIRTPHIIKPSSVLQ